MSMIHFSSQAILPQIVVRFHMTVIIEVNPFIPGLQLAMVVEKGCGLRNLVNISWEVSVHIMRNDILCSKSIIVRHQ